MTTSPDKHTNRLIHETSPYLQQHAHNPVDWYPWGEEALARARAENKPILLSIGYSACHWCHVMERESFENEAIAKLMNDHFINIKVDREERPDLDTIYMNAVQMLTGHGGWPMTMFLRPDTVPFYGGTYYPPVDYHNMPGFPRILISIAEAWRDRRDDINESAAAILGELGKLSQAAAGEAQLDEDLRDYATHHILRRLDHHHGGFGDRPKFPPSLTLSFLLRQYNHSRQPAELHAVELTLQKMALGGMYDQLGGGFHRYSVDEKWLVPHFEKMLYDNALLARLYLEAFQLTGNPFYQRITTETLDYVAREMTDAAGGFYSAQDADSEGIEGKFFVWSPAETESLLGAGDAALFNRYFDVTDGGNFEHGHSILHLDDDLETIARLMRVTPEQLSQVIERGKQILFDVREQRIKPQRDEKILTAWNGLMLRAFAEAARTLKRDDYLAIAIRNAEFVLTQMRRDARLLRTSRNGESKLNAYLEDYAFYADGLLALYEATFDVRWFREARALADTMIAQFYDQHAGGFYFTSHDHETLISRTKDFMDNATPSGNSVAVGVLLKLALLTGDMHYREIAAQTLLLLQDSIRRYPAAFGQLLCALDFHLGAPHEIAISGAPEAADTQALIDTVFSAYIPNKVVTCAAPDSGDAMAIPLLAARGLVNKRATAYVCHEFRCEAPVTDATALRAALGIS
ncbi:MAG: thioredoxin domain-containing protein [Blastocatellia bacterium]